MFHQTEETSSPVTNWSWRLLTQPTVVENTVGWPTYRWMPDGHLSTIRVTFENVGRNYFSQGWREKYFLLPHTNLGPYVGISPTFNSSISSSLNPAHWTNFPQKRLKNIINIYILYSFKLSNPVRFY